ncbi:GNAT family N-acetyltransferase [Primorskyibacter sp. S87]|uniref:GNAT family N-acetyltransferase n=1 Tax=Primorskyibacter sp. S87 TaxID=3415126 RepID=UPI003C7DAEC3
MIEIRVADPRSEDLRPLLAAHLSHSQDAGPQESNHTLDIADLCQPKIRLWVAYEAGSPVACGALKTLPDNTLEVKSVHVAKAARGRGLARQLMEHLHGVAEMAGADALVLETGANHLPEYTAARALYESLGYAYCGPIFGYEPDPNSAFMRLEMKRV